MTPTERVRELLDERGVEYTANERDTQWWPKGNPAGVLAENSRYPRDTLDVYGLTPEQAIAATLGREPDDAAMVKLHDQMNAAMFKYEMAQGIEKRDGDEAIVVPWVVKMHALLEEAATLDSCNCSNSERTDETCLPHFWTHDGTLHVELPKLPDSISVRLPDQRDREVGSARTWQYTRDSGTCHECAGMDDVFECSACGGRYEGWALKRWARYCPDCGRRIEVDE